MSERVAKMLASITAGAPNNDSGRGGIIHSVNTIMGALGYAQEHVPSGMGVHLVLAKYCDDEISYAYLMHPDKLPYEAHKIWWRLQITANTNRDTVLKLTKAALDDFCVQGIVQKKGEIYIRQRANVGHDLWTKVYKRYYSEIISTMNVLEGNVMCKINKYLQ